jgi:hypothetical protein
VSDPGNSPSTVLRTELREVFGNRWRLIKVIEDLVRNVAVTIPAAIDDSSRDTGSVLEVESFRRRDPVPSQLLSSGTGSDRVLGQAAFAPRAMPLAAAVPPDDAARVLATQIFGA